MSARQVIETCLAEIERRNDAVNAFVYLDAAAALAAADRLDRRIAAGKNPGNLAGVPFGIKDLRDRCTGMPTRNGSLFTADAPKDNVDSPQITRLKWQNCSGAPTCC